MCLHGELVHYKSYFLLCELFQEPLCRLETAPDSSASSKHLILCYANSLGQDAVSPVAYNLTMSLSGWAFMSAFGYRRNGFHDHPSDVGLISYMLMNELAHSRS